MSYPEIEGWLGGLRGRLSGRRARVDRAVAEARDHLMESTEELMRRGYPRDEAIEEALRRFGDAERMAAAFALVPDNHGALEELMLRLLTLSLAALTTLAALFGGGYALIVKAAEEAAWWTFEQLAGSLVVIAVGALTWSALRSGRQPLRPTLLLGAMALIAIGGFGIAWTIHLGVLTGDYEYGILMLHVLLIAQGVTTLWGLWSEAARLRPA